MPSCSILGCNNNSRRNNLSKGGITYHRFPKDPAFKEKWIDATGRKNWSSNKFSTICSSHFETGVFVIKKSGKKYLSDIAIPTQNILTFHCGESSVSNSIKHEEDDVDDGNMTHIPKNLERDAKPTSPSHAGANLCSPSKKKLTTIIKSQRLQIKRIQAQNRRLRSKLHNMEEVLLSVQNKLNFRNEDITSLQNENLKVEELMGLAHHFLSRLEDSGVPTLT